MCHLSNLIDRSRSVFCQVHTPMQARARESQLQQMRHHLCAFMAHQARGAQRFAKWRCRHQWQPSNELALLRSNAEVSSSRAAGVADPNTPDTAATQIAMSAAQPAGRCTRSRQHRQAQQAQVPRGRRCSCFAAHEWGLFQVARARALCRG